MLESLDMFVIEFGFLVCSYLFTLTGCLSFSVPESYRGQGSDSRTLRKVGISCNQRSAYNTHLANDAGKSMTNAVPCRSHVVPM